VETAITGLPPGPGELLQLVNRGVIHEGDFYRGIAEGDTRVEWGPYLIQLRHHITNPAVAAGLRLRGWRDAQYTYDVGALNGYTPDQMDELYLDRGRPAAPGQMETAWARGIDGPEGRPMDEAQFLKGIQESDIRPEYGPMLWGIRFAYPPLFQINRLRQSNAITTATAVDWATKERYAPEVLTALEAYWNTMSGSATAVAVDPSVKKAQGQLWTAAHKSFVAGEISSATAQGVLPTAGVAATAVGEVMTIWEAERSLIRAQLSVADIRKALNEDVVNPATGIAWTKDEAIAAMVARGYTQADAQTYMSS
jgi:hypothetical protein